MDTIPPLGHVRAESHPGETPLGLVSFLRTAVRQIVTGSATKVFRPGCQVQLRNAAGAGNAVDD